MEYSILLFPGFPRSDAGFFVRFNDLMMGILNQITGRKHDLFGF